MTMLVVQDEPDTMPAILSPFEADDFEDQPVNDHELATDRERVDAESWRPSGESVRLDREGQTAD